MNQQVIEMLETGVVSYKVGKKVFCIFNHLDFYYREIGYVTLKLWNMN